MFIGFINLYNTTTIACLNEADRAACFNLKTEFLVSLVVKQR